MTVFRKGELVMKKGFALLTVFLLLLSMTACQNQDVTESVTSADSFVSQEPVESTLSEMERDSIEPLPLSEMLIRVTCGEHSAVFQLYDTEAALDLYEQLPLILELENFRDAQWMFYPPEELGVTDAEVYHDGRRGELSYYAPWGDVFMLYEDFKSGDEMHRLGICTEGMDSIEGMSGSVLVEAEGSENPDTQETTEDNTMNVIVGDTTFTATLADNSSAQALVELLQEGPLTIEMSDYGNMEKVGPIGQTLPSNNEQITTEPGDIILYQSNSLVIYYDTNSWNFTRIGKINDVTQEELLDALGSGDVSVTFALSDDESRS